MAPSLLLLSHYVDIHVYISTTRHHTCQPIRGKPGAAHAQNSTAVAAPISRSAESLNDQSNSQKKDASILQLHFLLGCARFFFSIEKPNFYKLHCALLNSIFIHGFTRIHAKLRMYVIAKKNLIKFKWNKNQPSSGWAFFHNEFYWIMRKSVFPEFSIFLQWNKNQKIDSSSLIAHLISILRSRNQ